MANYDEAALQAMGLSVGLPRHVGIIMDGNGRWATNRGLPRTLGHRAGVERLRGIIQLTSDIGIEALSLYAFSTENWKRPDGEIGALFELFVEYFIREIDALHRNGVCIRVLGDLSSFPKKVEEPARAAMARTAKNTGLKLNIALNYGGRTEIINAARALGQQIEAGLLKPESITEELFAGELYTSGLPELDLLIRTGGEQRISNFLLYQAAYAELSFVKDFWPDFSDERYLACLKEFVQRDRRYGGIK